MVLNSYPLSIYGRRMCFNTPNMYALFNRCSAISMGMVSGWDGEQNT